MSFDPEHHAVHISKKWKEIAILKLLFPSTPYFLRDLKLEGNSNENGRK